MNRRFSMIAVLVLTFISLSFAQPSQVVQTQFDIMLKSVKDNSYARFVSSGSEEFKSKYVPESFEMLRGFMAERLAQGYEATYLTSLNMRGYTVFLWKLSFQDSGDDSLVSLSVANGFVAGFLIQ